MAVYHKEVSTHADINGRRERLLVRGVAVPGLGVQGRAFIQSNVFGVLGRIRTTYRTISYNEGASTGNGLS